MTTTTMMMVLRMLRMRNEYRGRGSESATLSSLVKRLWDPFGHFKHILFVCICIRTHSLTWALNAPTIMYFCRTNAIHVYANTHCSIYHMLWTRNFIRPFQSLVFPKSPAACSAARALRKQVALWWGWKTQGDTRVAYNIIGPSLHFDHTSPATK